MTFDGRYEQADGPGTTWSEQELRRAGKDSGDAGVSAEPRGREEYYEALRAASNGGSSDGDGDGPDAQDGDHTDAGDSSGEEKHAGDSGTDAGEGGDAPGGGGSAWDSVEAEERPPIDAARVTADRAKHILDGDDKGGGHRHGTGKPGKTEFPASWDDEKILDLVRDVARHPDRPPFHQDNGRWRMRGTREDVEIVAIVERDAQVWTGWPRSGGPGVVKNPKET